MSTSSLDYLLKLSSNIDLQILIVTILIAILGWIIALVLQRQNVKHQHKVSVQYDIYKHFVELHKEIQNPLFQLGAKTISPFILMRCSMIPFETKLKNEQECLAESEKKWLEFTQLLQTIYFDFDKKYLNLLYIFEDWTAPLKKLLLPEKAFAIAVNNLKNQIYTNINTLRDYNSQHNRDWRKWDQKEIENILQNIRENTSEIGSYIHDLMVLIHNELLSTYFGRKRYIRKTLDQKYKVLTQKGIITNLDKKFIKQMGINYDLLLKKVASEIKNKNNSKDTESLNKGICPQCKNEVQVININKTDAEITYQFICGDSWKIKNTKKIK